MSVFFLLAAAQNNFLYLPLVCNEGQVNNSKLSIQNYFHAIVCNKLPFQGVLFIVVHSSPKALPLG